MSFPIMNPRVPYEGPIQGPVQHGLMIFVNGSVPYGAGRFSVNLVCGSGSTADIAFHFNPRFEGLNTVVRNSRQYNSWGSEERHGGFPFQHGMQLEMIILVQSDCYKVAINGVHFTEFRHRLPMERVTTLMVDGNVNLTSIRFQAPSGYPPAHAPPSGPPAGMVQPSGLPSPLYNPPVPHESMISGGFYPGRMVYISGIVNPNVQRFTINLRCSRSSEIAFHFDVRFSFGSDRHVIVRNSEIGRRWGSEERHASYFPFVPNGNFDMIFLCEANCFKVAVNNRHFIEYNHRIKSLHTIDKLTVDGDLRLTQIRHQ